jgi:hypothetical protein
LKINYSEPTTQQYNNSTTENFSIAQLEERYPSKVVVLGSNPSGETGCEKTQVDWGLSAKQHVGGSIPSSHSIKLPIRLIGRT